MMHSLKIIFLVGMGGFAGSVLRYSFSLASQRFSFEWPLGTLAANVLGSLAIGVIMGLVARGESISPEMRLALATGFCGGFTTLSSMIYETAQMMRASEYLHAAFYATGTFALSLMAFLAGSMAVRMFIKTGGQ